AGAARHEPDADADDAGPEGEEETSGAPRVPRRLRRASGVELGPPRRARTPSTAAGGFSFPKGRNHAPRRTSRTARKSVASTAAYAVSQPRSLESYLPADSRGGLERREHRNRLDTNRGARTTGARPPRGIPEFSWREPTPPGIARAHEWIAGRRKKRNRKR